MSFIHKILHNIFFSYVQLNMLQNISIQYMQQKNFFFTTSTLGILFFNKNKLHDFKLIFKTELSYIFILNVLSNFCLASNQCNEKIDTEIFFMYNKAFFLESWSKQKILLLEWIHIVIGFSSRPISKYEVCIGK